MKRIVIFGYGADGREITALLTARGEDVLVAQRTAPSRSPGTRRNTPSASADSSPINSRSVILLNTRERPFTYADDDPINAIDPSGMSPDICALAFPLCSYEAAGIAGCYQQSLGKPFPDLGEAPPGDREWLECQTTRSINEH